MCVRMGVAVVRCSGVLGTDWPGVIHKIADGQNGPDNAEIEVMQGPGPRICSVGLSIGFIVLD